MGKLELGDTAANTKSFLPKMEAKLHLQSRYGEIAAA